MGQFSKSLSALNQRNSKREADHNDRLFLMNLGIILPMVVNTVNKFFMKIDTPQWQPDSYPSAGHSEFMVDENDTEPNQVENILTQSNEIHQSQGTESVSWVMQALQQAHLLREQPRSVDNTAIGLNEDSLGKLAQLEAELGSEQPVASAHSMQKVVAAQVTPETSGSGRLKDEEIEGFFDDLLN